MKRHDKKKTVSAASRRVRDIEEVLRNGVWRDDPWFLREPGGMTSSNGHGVFTRAEMVRASDMLARLYTADACRQIFANPGRGPLIAILFMNCNRELLFHFLRLGLDLEDIGKSSKVLFERLRDGAEHESACLETELWAALVRSDVRVDRPTAGLAHGVPSADFSFPWDYRQYSLEAKLLWRSDGDVIGAEIVQRVLQRGLVVPGAASGVSIEFSDALASLTQTHDGRKTLQILGDQIVDRIVELVQGFTAGAITAGEHDVAGLGSLSLSPGDSGGALSIQGFRKTPAQKESDRILRHVSDASMQLPSTGKRVVFVDTHDNVDIDDLGRLLHARVAAGAVRLSNVDFVIVRRSRLQPVPAVIPLPGVALTQADHQLATILAAGRRAFHSSRVDQPSVARSVSTSR